MDEEEQNPIHPKRRNEDRLGIPKSQTEIPDDQKNLKPFVSFLHSKSGSVRLSILTRILVIFFEFVNSPYEAIS